MPRAERLWADVRFRKRAVCAVCGTTNTSRECTKPSDAMMSECDTLLADIVGRHPTSLPRPALG